MPEPDAGVHLEAVGDHRADIDVLADRLAGRVGLTAVLADLDRRGRRSWAPGLAARYAFTWDRDDRRTPLWWPQGISTSADADESGLVLGRRLLAVSWYAKDSGGRAGPGARITFVDLDTLRYRHVLLVAPTRGADGAVTVAPVRIHAGGLAWWGGYLHVAATARGLFTFHVDDLLRVPEDDAEGRDGAQGADGPEGLETFGHRYLLPLRLAHRAGAASSADRLRYSFLSVDRQVSPPRLLAGEYARGSQSRRLAHFDLDPASQLPATDADGVSRPLRVHDDGVAQTQGAVLVGDRYYLTVSHGPWLPGSVYVGRPGAFRRRRWATPMGPEDLAYWPGTDELWSLSEHPRRRWVFAMPRGVLDR